MVCELQAPPPGPFLAPPARFFNDRRRINVALSRARHLCVLVGSPRTLQAAGAKEPAWTTLLRHYSE